MLQFSSPFMEKLHKKKSQDYMWLQQWTISHVAQTDCNRYPLDDESVLTRLCHQKTITWKDIERHWIMVLSKIMYVSFALL